MFAGELNFIVISPDAVCTACTSIPPRIVGTTAWTSKAPSPSCGEIRYRSCVGDKALTPTSPLEMAEAGEPDHGCECVPSVGLQVSQVVVAFSFSTVNTTNLSDMIYKSQAPGGLLVMHLLLHQLAFEHCVIIRSAATP
jgi:hypothetical protein